MKRKLNKKNIAKLLLVIAFMGLITLTTYLIKETYCIDYDQEVSCISVVDMKPRQNTFKEDLNVIVTSTTTTFSAYSVSTETTTPVVNNSYNYYGDNIMNINYATEDDISAECIEDTECEWTDDTMQNGDIEVDDYTYISLCNLVAGEYGSDYVSIYEKGAVVACVIHRWWDGNWVDPYMDNTIINVINASGQFDAAYCSSYYATNVTQSVKEAVTYALNNMDQYEYYIDPWGESHYNIKSFVGDGEYNYFN